MVASGIIKIWGGRVYIHVCAHTCAPALLDTQEQGWLFSKETKFMCHPDYLTACSQNGPSQNCRMSGSGWTAFGGHLCNLLLKTGSAPRSVQVVRVCVQSLPGNIRRLSLHNLSGQSSPMFDCPFGDKTSPCIQSEPPFFQTLSVISHFPSTAKGLPPS